MANWAELLQSNKKWKVFGYVLLAIFIVGTILSLLTKITFIEDDKSTRPRLAVVAPSTPAGDALRKGASL